MTYGTIMIVFFMMWLIIYVAWDVNRVCLVLHLRFFSGSADYLANPEVKLPNNKTENGQTNINGR